jgi:hypothetical protein
MEISRTPSFKKWFGDWQNIDPVSIEEYRNITTQINEEKQRLEIETQKLFEQTGDWTLLADNTQLKKLQRQKFELFKKFNISFSVTEILNLNHFSIPVKIHLKNLIPKTKTSLAQDKLATFSPLQSIKKRLLKNLMENLYITPFLT